MTQVKPKKSPRVGCGALIKNKSGDILLVKRLRSPEIGHWGFPGGKVDYGETVENAIQRKILEELGVEIELSKMVHLVNYIDLDQNQHWVAPVYLAAICTGDPKILEPDALEHFAWFSPSNLPAPLTQATLQTLTAQAILP